MATSKTKPQLLRENEDLRARLREAEETLRAIRSGEVDALVVSGPQGDQIYTLQGADRLYRVLIETMEEGAAILGAGGAILYCNRRMAEMLETSMERVVGSSLENHISPADWQALKDIHGRGERGGNRREIRMRTAAGTFRPVLASLGRMEAGGVEGICLTAADLSEQKWAEENLRQAHDSLEKRVQERTAQLTRSNQALATSENRYRSLFSRMTEGFALHEMICDAGGDPCDYRFLDINPAFEALTGLKREEVVNRTFREVLPDEDREWVRRYGEVALTGRSVHFENYSPSLKRHYEVFAYSPAPRQFAVLFMDITARKRAEEAAAAAHRQLQSIIDNTPALVYAFDLEERFLMVNTAVAQVLNTPPERMIGKRRHEFMPGEDADWHEAHDRQVIEAGKALEFEEYSRLPGRSITWHTTKFPLRDGQGTIYAVAGVSADISERKRAEEELRKGFDELEARVGERTSELAKAVEDLKEEIVRREKAEQQLLQAQKLESIGTLTGGIAHDFNNILGAILINAEMALLDLPPGEGVRKKVELILKSGERGRDLVSQMLLFSRKSERKQNNLSLTPLIKETFKLLRSSLPTTLEMGLHLKTGSDSVFADPSQLQQVVMNLCTNAAYAMRGTIGSIDLSLEEAAFGAADLPEPDMEPGDYLVLSVRDSGGGMDEGVRKRIFEPFFTTKPVGEGTGLGLSVVHGIVKSHRGGITVDSEPGKGSVFKIYLPKADTRVFQRAEAAKAVPGGNERVLFVDDEEIIVQSVRNMLEHLGYRVTTATDSGEALKLFSEGPSEFDLVVTDQTMPGMTGEDLGKELMRIRPDVPVILCTGYSELVTSEKATALGFQGFIMKPFTLRESAELVRRVLDQNRPK